MSLLPSAVQSLRSSLRVRPHLAVLSSTSTTGFSPANHQHQQRCCRWKHNKTVRIILTKDTPNGKNYKGEVLDVKPGYARNHLIPQKIALYATRENFERLNMKDPNDETEQERAERLAKETMSDRGAKQLKAADILKHYLRNKVVSPAIDCTSFNILIVIGIGDTYCSC